MNPQDLKDFSSFFGVFSPSAPPSDLDGISVDLDMNIGKEESSSDMETSVKVSNHLDCYNSSDLNFRDRMNPSSEILQNLRSGMDVEVGDFMVASGGSFDDSDSSNNVMNHLDNIMSVDLKSDLNKNTKGAMESFSKSGKDVAGDIESMEGVDSDSQLVEPGEINNFLNSDLGMTKNPNFSNLEFSNSLSSKRKLARKIVKKRDQKREPVRKNDSIVGRTSSGEMMFEEGYVRRRVMGFGDKSSTKSAVNRSKSAPNLMNSSHSAVKSTVQSHSGDSCVKSGYQTPKPQTPTPKP